MIEKDEVILITGGTGFLGRHLAAELRGRGYTQVREVGTGHADLRIPAETNELFARLRPVAVYHLAGYNGGISFNEKFPADVFHANVLMGLNVVAAAAAHKVRWLACAMASCGYPVNKSGVYDTDDWYSGSPHASVACHGEAKRAVSRACDNFGAQYGLRSVCFVPPTLYGPGDRYDEGRSKFVSGLVKKFVDAADSGAEEVVCRGSGKPLRDVMHVRDAASVLADFATDDEAAWPALCCMMNVGNREEVSVAQVASLVAMAAGFRGRIKWTGSQDDGQMRKLLKDGESPENPTAMHVGLTEMVADYRARKLAEKGEGECGDR